MIGLVSCGEPQTINSGTEAQPSPAVEMEDVVANGYAFREIVVRPARDSVSREVIDNRIELSFVPMWVGDAYPGTRPCKWVASDGSGVVVGRANHNFTVLESGIGRMSFGMTVDAEPAALDVTCGTRIDDPSAHFEFGDVRVAESKGNSDVLVSADYTWDGGPNPSPASCRIDVKDAQGVLVVSDTRTFTALDDKPRTAEFELALPEGATAAREVTAELACEAMFGR